MLMARYFFDVSDDELLRDEEGLEFADAQCAAHEALQSLPDMAKRLLPTMGSETVAITMRNEHGTALYRAKLTIEGVWLQDEQ